MCIMQQNCIRNMIEFSPYINGTDLLLEQIRRTAPIKKLKIMMNIPTFQIEVTEEQSGARVDKFISDQLDSLSRSYVQKLIKDEYILADQKIVKSNYKVMTGDQITVYVPEPEEVDIEPENIPIEILYEDADIVVINKEKGMVVHPAAGHYTGTLVNALLYHCKGQLSGINGILRPGIVHRIDMNTTGVIVVCKNDFSHNFVAEQLKEHSITRKYHALVYGGFKEAEGIVDAPIGRHPTDRKRMAINHKNGKNAVTHFNVIESLGNKYSYLECRLETGRTHQIRVHMSSIHHPLVGDDVYGPKKDPFHLQGQSLHAGVLGFIHPSTKEYVEFTAPLPEYFLNLIHVLKMK